MDNIIEIKGLSKTFYLRSILSPIKPKRNVVALNGVDLKVDRGEIIGLAGPNGAGKTTLIKIICCLIMPSSGCVMVNGFDSIKEAEKVQASIGLVSGDERSFYWRLTGRENLEFFGVLYGLRGNDLRERVRELLLDVGLDNETDKRVLIYSTGLRQRLAIARALINDPSVLVFDEFSKGLDPTTAKRMGRYILEKLVIGRGKTVIIASHNLEELENLCTRIAIMDRGIVRGVLSAQEIKQNEKSSLWDVYREMTEGN